MSMSAGIAAGAAAQSAAATAAAAAAQKTACMKFVQGFQNDTATVAEMQEYAGCIGRLHPQELSDGATWVVKLAILIVFAGAVVGGFNGHRDRWDDWTSRYIFMPFMGATVAVGGLLVVGLVVAGVAFLVS